MNNIDQVLTVEQAEQLRRFTLRYSASTVIASATYHDRPASTVAFLAWMVGTGRLGGCQDGISHA